MPIRDSLARSWLDAQVRRDLDDGIPGGVALFASIGFGFVAGTVAGIYDGTRDPLDGAFRVIGADETVFRRICVGCT